MLCRQLCRRVVSFAERFLPDFFPHPWFPRYTYSVSEHNFIRPRWSSDSIHAKFDSRGEHIFSPDDLKLIKRAARVRILDIYFLGKEGEAEKGRGVQRPILQVNEVKKTGARSAH